MTVFIHKTRFKTPKV